ncbi:hypothetical protein CSC12_2525 [Klebsiella michiganensis]|nr:hypothetical protein CSC12_2525 [Klebsiella michiganensis]
MAHLNPCKTHMNPQICSSLVAQNAISYPLIILELQMVVVLREQP